MVAVAVVNIISRMADKNSRRDRVQIGRVFQRLRCATYMRYTSNGRAHTNAYADAEESSWGRRGKTVFVKFR